MRSEIKFGCGGFSLVKFVQTQIKLSFWTLEEIYILFSFLRMWISLFTECQLSVYKMELRHLAHATLRATIHRYRA